MDTFNNFPPEIRNMIYKLLLVQNTLIPISSPRRGYKLNRTSTSPTANFRRLIQVSKKISSEACTTFYSLNRFYIGNGRYGSSRHPNLHALRSFIGRVNPQYLACISHICIFMHLAGVYAQVIRAHQPRSDFKFGLHSSQDATDLRAISRAIVQHFKQVEIVTLVPCYFTPRAYDGSQRLERECSIKGIAHAIEALLKHPHLKGIEITRCTNFQVQESVERVLKATQSDVVFQSLRIDGYRMVAS